MSGKLKARIITRTIEGSETLDDIKKGEIVVNLNTGNAIIGRSDNENDNSSIRINDSDLKNIENALGDNNNETGETLFGRTQVLEEKLGNPTKEDDDPFSAQDAAFPRIERLEGKIESFLEGAELGGDVIDTLQEIQKYISDDKQLINTINGKITSKPEHTNSFYSVNSKGENSNINYSFGTECLVPLRHEGRLFAEVNTEKAAPNANTMNKQVINLGYFNDNIGDKTQEEITKINTALGSQDDTSNKDTAFGKIKKLEEKNAVDVTGLENTVTNVLTPKVTELETTIGESTDTLSETTVFGKINELNNNKVGPLMHKQILNFPETLAIEMPASNSEYTNTTLAIDGNNFLYTFFKLADNGQYEPKQDMPLGTTLILDESLNPNYNIKFRLYQTPNTSTPSTLFTIHVVENTVTNPNQETLILSVVKKYNEQSYTVTRNIKYIKSFTNEETIKIDFSSIKDNNYFGANAIDILSNSNAIYLTSDAYLIQQEKIDFIVKQGVTTNGWYRKWAGGLLEIWGSHTSTSDAETLVSFPIAFQTIYNLQVTPHHNSGEWICFYNRFGYNITNKGFTYRIQNGVTIHYYACGTAADLNLNKPN